MALGRVVVIGGVLGLVLGGAGAYGVKSVVDKRAAERAAEAARAREEQARRRKEEARALLAKARDTLSAAIDERMRPDAAAVEAFVAAAQAATIVDEGAAQPALAGARGLDALLAGRTDEAKAELTKAVEGGEDFVGRIGLGWLVLAGARPNDAWGEFNLAAKASPDSRSARYGRALADAAGDENSRAFPVLREATTWWPERPEAASTYADVLRKTGDIPQALQWYQSAIQLGARDARTIEGWVTVAVQRLEFSPRLEIESWIASDPTRHDLHTQLGRLQLAAGETAAAEASFRRGIELAPEVLGPRIELASLMVEKKRYAEALTLLEPVSTSQDPVLVGVLGHALMGDGRTEEAKETFKKSCQGGLGASCEECCYLEDPDCCAGVRGERRLKTAIEYLNRKGSESGGEHIVFRPRR